MALDRRITIRIEGVGRRAGMDETEIDPEDGQPYSAGEYIPGPIVSYFVWAERRSAGSNDSPTTSGFITVSAQNYLVRWFEELETANLALVDVVDEFGAVWDADSIAPGDARRRLITLQVLRTT